MLTAEPTPAPSFPDLPDLAPPADGWIASNEAAMRAIQKMKIDRDERVAVFALVDGSEIATSFVPRDRADWPDGCPTNLLIHRMQVLDLEEDILTIGPITLDRPILVRDCPRDPMRVVLREDGEIGGGIAALWLPDRAMGRDRGGRVAPVHGKGASGSSSAIEGMAISRNGTACGGAGERISFETASNTTSLRCSVK